MCKFFKKTTCNVNAAIFYLCHTNLTIHNYQKLHVNGLEVMHSDVNSVTTGQGRNYNASLKLRKT